MTMIYGIDTDGDVTPVQVRDAILECFFHAHCADAQLGLDDDKMNKDYCKAIVKKTFADTGGDFDNPTKEDILNVMSKLAEFAKSFRDPTIIQKHSAEIMQLIEKL